MAESAEHHGEKLQGQPILSDPPIPRIFVSTSNEEAGFETALDAVLADGHATAQNPDLTEAHETLPIVSDLGREKPGSLLFPSYSSSIGQDGDDGNLTYEKEYVGWFVQEPRAAGSMLQPDSYPKIHFVSRPHPTPRQSSVSSYIKRRQRDFIRSCFQAVVPSSVDGPFDMRSPAVAAKASPFVTGNAQIGPELKTFTYPLEASGPHLGSTNGLLGKAGDNDNLVVHSAEFYLKFTDDFRHTFKNGIAMYDEEVDMLSSVLEEILESEINGKALIPFKTILTSRLEKLIQSLANHPKGCRDASPETFLTAVRLAVTIQFKWQKRFGAQLFYADEKRIEYMVMYGLLARVIMQSSPKGDGSAEWVATAPLRGAGASLINFPLGQWWLNIACALRDGVVILTGEKNNSSHQVATYLPLLRGAETFDSESGCTVYEIEGRREDVFTQLHDKVGKKIRLIRGHHLKSVNAPEIGIRYDGVYILRLYSLKVSDADKHLHHLKLHYDPVEGESGINKDILKTSASDDWEMYKKIEKGQMKRFCSEAGFYSWQAGEEREVKDTQEWHRRQKFRGQAKELKV